MRVLVTGGAGYIGSHTVVALQAAGHGVTVADNFSNSRRGVIDRIGQLSDQEVPSWELDLTVDEDVDILFANGDFDAVIHCAGFKAVGESVTQPALYYRNNLDSALVVIGAMQKYGVRRLVFSSSATVYGGRHPVPFREDLWPLEASNPYGQTKVMIERILSDVAKANDGWRVALLRYFNPVGADASGLLGEEPRGVPNNLMPIIAQVAMGQREKITVYGGDYETRDGTGERDYIHVSDLAEGHVRALDSLDGMKDPVRAFNLGTGQSTSVIELIRAFELACGRPIPFSIGPRRDGDIGIAFADPSRAHAELGWMATRSIHQMCVDAWRWQTRLPRVAGTS